MSEDNDVTMDTHAVVAALLKPLSGKSKQVGQNFGTGTSNSGPLGLKGVYYAFADAYVKAAKEKGILPREMQSITWEAARGLFTDSYKANKANVKEVNDIFKDYTNGKITKDEAREKVLEAAGGVNDPTWSGPILSELGKDSKKKADTGRLPGDERGGKRSEAKPRDRGRDTGDVSGVTGRESKNLIRALERKRKPYRLGNMIKREKVKGVFKKHPELSRIGTEEQYSEYLESIFPNSKLKEILYRGDRGKRIGQYYSFDEDYASTFGDTRYSVIINTENPLDITSTELQLDSNLISSADTGIGWEAVKEEVLDETGFDFDKDFKKGDSVIGLDAGSSTKAIYVKNTDQVFVLGSKKDTQGFKDFLEKSPAGREQKTAAQIKKEKQKREEKKLYAKIGMTPEEVSDWKKSNKKGIKMPHPAKALEAAKKYAANEISLKKYDQEIKKHMPIFPYKQVPTPATVEEIVLALSGDKAIKGIVGLTISIEDGTIVSSRLDIPAYMNFGIYVDTIHGPGGKGVLGYGETVVLENVDFRSKANLALKIATTSDLPQAPSKVSDRVPGQEYKANKSPFAVMEGAFKNESTESAVKRAEEALKSDEWVQVGFNPYRHAYFYDKANSKPVVSAKEVIQVGPLVMAKGVVYGEPLEFKDKKTGEIVRFQKDESNPLGNYEMQKNALKGKIKAIIDFKNKYGRYFNVQKEFNDQRHMNNYISFMERKGNKEIGIERVAEVPDVSPTQPFAGREQKNAPLFSGKNRKIIDLANKYIAKKGLAAPEDTEIRRLNTDYSKAMADTYEAAKNTPLDKDVQRAYKALAKESKDQFEALKKDGYVVELWDGANQPYENSTEMVADLKDNKHLYVFSTEEGFGETGITPQDRRENPMLADSGYKDANGKKLLLNDLFRFVHDAFGHGKLGNSFGPVGEENAWYVHSQMFSPDARRAMTSETRGQNSWVNFGPQLRNKDGSLPKRTV